MLVVVNGQKIEIESQWWTVNQCVVEVKMRWQWGQKWSENRKTRKTIRYDDLMLNEHVDAIICYSSIGLNDYRL